MGSLMGLIGSVIVVIAALAQCTAAATTYNVGDSAGWTVQSYDSWLSGKKFVVGDKLNFTFNPQFHDVALVSKTNYDGCTNTTISVNTTSPTLITLDAPGERYYICTFPGHCLGGQKLSISVSSTAGSPGPSPTPTAGSTPSSPGSPSSGSAPPSPSSAPSRAAAFGVAGAFMAVLTALFL